MGNLDDVAILTVELPRAASGAPTPSVNYSGPTAAVVAAHGDARASLQMLGKRATEE